MAPEVLKNGKYGRKADVYSFAILMFEVVTDSSSYPELEEGKLTDFEFRNKVTSVTGTTSTSAGLKKKSVRESCSVMDTNRIEKSIHLLQNIFT
ncbi:hypothetical protein M9Y10_026575 [Tritrichomonas musculus]|uniref:Protein kinase domain-containing protein n=1 Tax=Tritrichomonas musculus TaxID=1915356 RepID=A0ABR2H619_9EUKA